MITLDTVGKTFPATRRQAAVTALEDVSLTVERGQVMGVVGPSGSGKSTLARIVNLLERPTTGTVTVDGLDLTALTSARALNDARRGIGMIFQQFNLLDSRTALANVELPLELAGVGRAERRARAGELLERVGLGDKLGSHPSQLSGGQRQRVAIARALAPRPKVLLCDEATSALDPVSTASVLALVRTLTDELDLTTLLITHEMDVVKRVCDHVTLLEHGRVVDSGALGDVVARPESPLATRLLPHPGPPSDDRAVEVVVGGDSPDTVLTDLIRRYDVHVTVLGGAVETLGGQRFGRLQLRVDGAPDEVRGALDHLAAHQRPTTETAA
ncbi:methionine ABC transporter ATP-binding protein [Ornithinimicrobium tianjinense]|uniref:Methionine import ATP-binding protein MetN n=1 Tax=Ornithinimicrobium tianjinense TaxID=1195761 RepID=A0A917BQX3_9MICO|nr:ATP-binding cassette domain-containing protein [Ornithinimicrobium tianjinense]GGF55417.1 methionine import ATP-binding protein MetN [Ornithinimicrobium tianjinense]